MGKDVQIFSDDGFVLKGQLYKPEGKKKPPVAVLVHQFGSSLKMWEDFYPSLIESGYAVLLIDLRGHGKSILKNGKETKIFFKENFRSPADIINFFKKSNQNVNFSLIPDDISLWIDHLIESENIDPERVILVGSSLGGISIFPVVLQQDIKCLVSISPGSPVSVGKERIDLSLSYYENPVMIVSSLNDPLGSSKVSLYLMERLNNGTLILISGKYHGKPLIPKVKGYILQFLKKCDGEL